MAFENCAAAYAAGRSNIPKSDPDYGPHLDRDKDGFGCDNPPAGFKPAPVKPAEDAAPATKAGTTVHKGVSGEALPQTGPAADLGIAGAVLLLAGLIGAGVSRRRRTRFTA